MDVGEAMPKSSDLRQLDQADPDAIAAELNGHPLGFKTLSQALTEAFP
jgi:hypothetical protein